MEREQQIQKLNQILLGELPQYKAQAQRVARDTASQRSLLRGLMNLRPPMPLNRRFLDLQDELLCAERDEKGIVDGMRLPVVKASPNISIWQGDITRLKVDAIVNAGNSALLGCFCPCHGCIDNAIHSAAGLQLREECYQIMQKQGHEEANGYAKLTRAYNLPAKYVLHTVGPIIPGQGQVTEQAREELAACYASCLALAAKHKLESVAFCCISTGEFHFPNQEAAQIAVHTVKRFLMTSTSIRKVIFNVFKDPDAEIYRQLLEPACAASAKTE